ncbi:MAG: hypothetical protein K4H23_05010, partial [Mollicutes bacterium PWAP]|nr:hypothetical protein [Mollicutes bacterium PWAP]
NKYIIASLATITTALPITAVISCSSKSEDNLKLDNPTQNNSNISPKVGTSNNTPHPHNFFNSHIKMRPGFMGVIDSIENILSIFQKGTLGFTDFGERPGQEIVDGSIHSLLSGPLNNLLDVFGSDINDLLSSNQFLNASFTDSNDFSLTIKNLINVVDKSIYILDDFLNKSSIRQTSIDNTIKALMDLTPDVLSKIKKLIILLPDILWKTNGDFTMSAAKSLLKTLITHIFDGLETTLPHVFDRNDKDNKLFEEIKNFSWIDFLKNIAKSINIDSIINILEPIKSDIKDMIVSSYIKKLELDSDGKGTEGEYISKVPSIFKPIVNTFALDLEKNISILFDSHTLDFEKVRKDIANLLLNIKTNINDWKMLIPGIVDSVMSLEITKADISKNIVAKNFKETFSITDNDVINIKNDLSNGEIDGFIKIIIKNGSALLTTKLHDFIKDSVNDFITNLSKPNNNNNNNNNNNSSSLVSSLVSSLASSFVNIGENDLTYLLSEMFAPEFHDSYDYEFVDGSATKDSIDQKNLTAAELAWGTWLKNSGILGFGSTSGRVEWNNNIGTIRIVARQKSGWFGIKQDVFETIEIRRTPTTPALVKTQNIPQIDLIDLIHNWSKAAQQLALKTFWSQVEAPFIQLLADKNISNVIFTGHNKIIIKFNNGDPDLQIIIPKFIADALTSLFSGQDKWSDVISNVINDLQSSQSLINFEIMFKDMFSNLNNGISYIGNLLNPLINLISGNQVDINGQDATLNTIEVINIIDEMKNNNIFLPQLEGIKLTENQNSQIILDIFNLYKHSVNGTTPTYNSIENIYLSSTSEINKQFNIQVAQKLAAAKARLKSIADHKIKLIESAKTELRKNKSSIIDITTLKPISDAKINELLTKSLEKLNISNIKSKNLNEQILKNIDSSEYKIILDVQNEKEIESILQELYKIPSSKNWDLITKGLIYSKINDMLKKGISNGSIILNIGLTL